DSLTAYGVVRFQALPQRWFPIPGDTAGVSVGSIDSVVIDLRMEARDTSVDNTYLRVFLLPQSKVDTTATFDSLASYFQGVPVDSIPIADSVAVGNLHHPLPVAPLTPVQADSFRMALGFAVRGDSATAAILGTSQLGTAPLLRYYVRGAAPQDTFTTVFSVASAYDSYVRNPEAGPPPVGTIVVGNQPASRAFLQFNIPSYYVDSVTVLRATLHLQLTRPVGGFPGESYRVTAIPLLRYFGGKSIIFPDTNGVTGSGNVLVGASGRASIEIGRIVRIWHGINPDSLPRAITLRSAAENFTFAQIDAAGASGGANAPSLQLTFVRPFVFGVP
ncbi:MAG: hypothetical protein L0271_23770, partial [Gemmatimonadetes bacterium]|nr:hypothetical protein [Gemmatimonadota bacterium]